MKNGQSNLVFFTKFQDTLNSSFILFETKLEQVLYSLAESPIVYSIVERCVKNYDYSQAKQKYLLAPTFERNGAFIAPVSRREFIAFASNLLYEIYEKKILHINYKVWRLTCCFCSSSIYDDIKFYMSLDYVSA